MGSGIAKLIYTFGRLTQIEAAVNTAVAKSKIPSKEIKVMLRSTHPLQVERTPLFQYLKGIFEEIGLGHMRCGSIEPFSMNVKVKDSNVVKLFSDVKGKTCYVTADALKMFFEKDMDIPVEVKEVKCVNDGDDYCEFHIEMNPVGVLNHVIDERDFEILKLLKSGKRNKKVSKELERYMLVKDGKLTVLGKRYLEIRETPMGGNVERPWKRLSQLSEVTASAKSFAEAFSKSIENEVEEIDESKIVDIVKEAEKSKSFAELMLKVMKKEVNEDE